MVEQSTVRAIVLGAVVLVTLHALTSALATKSENEASSSKDESAVADEQSDLLKPWRDRWDAKRIGFHLEDVNPWLVKYVEKILPKDTCSNTRIFVPLCGKTIDMAYLVKQGAAQVVGVEGIRQALVEFVREQPDLKISTDTTTSAGFETFQGPNISLLKGDYFELTDENAGGKFGAIFDRASMVAISPSLRRQYVEVIGKLLEPQGKILLITLERKGKDAEAVARGPPFSISEAQVRELYEGLDWVESVTLLDAKDQFEDSPEDRKRYEGLDHLMQLAFLIQAK